MSTTFSFTVMKVIVILKIKVNNYHSIFSYQLSSDNAILRTSASFAKEKVSLVEEELKKSKQLEARIVRYPNAKPLALNVIHKVIIAVVN